MNQLTNHELIQELRERIHKGNLKLEAIPEQFEKKTKSLFHYLNNESLLLLVGLTVGFTFLICYILEVTTTSVTGGSLDFWDQEGKII